MINSREKGKRFERAVAQILCKFGWQAKRAQQHCGAAGDADLITNFPAHIECKHRRRPEWSAWWRQACTDAPPGKRPIVVYRINRGSIMVLFRLADWPWFTPHPGLATPNAPAVLRAELRILPAIDFFPQHCHIRHVRLEE